MLSVIENEKVVMMILIDNRLMKCAQMIEGNGIVCDVGTDHAYLPAYLVLNNICKQAIAADIADGPLEAAKATVEKYNISDKVSLIKSDGLKNISPDGITDVIIAGMGAETICEIIDSAPWLKNNINIIIQPMTKHPYIRQWLYKNGFEIIKEEAVPDNEFIYTIMNIRYCGNRLILNDIFSNAGKFDFSEENAKRYALRQVKRIDEIVNGINKSGKNPDILENLKSTNDAIKTLACGNTNLTVGMVYQEINRISPFSTQDSWDNSGLITGDMNNKVNRILVALDITNAVIDEAVDSGADLIVSHHPVIFHALKTLSFTTPAARLIANGISAICVHTPIDMAEFGINDIISDMLRYPLKLNNSNRPFEPLKPGSMAGNGRICELTEPMPAYEVALILKEVFGCPVVKYTDSNTPVSKIAICSGSGGSFLNDVIISGCDAYITGDIKHDIWVEAANRNFTLYDCGHFYTERVVTDYLVSVLKANTCCTSISAALSDKDVVRYI